MFFITFQQTWLALTKIFLRFTLLILTSSVRLGRLLYEKAASVCMDKFFNVLSEAFCKTESK
jgi:hypothetical protein